MAKYRITWMEELPRNPYHATSLLRCASAKKYKGSIEKACTPQYALVYLVSGSMRLTISGESHMVNAGQAFQRIPEQAHQCEFVEESVTAWIAVPAEVYRLMQLMHLQTLDQVALPLNPKWGFLTRHRKLAKELLDTPPQRSANILTKLQALIVDMHLQIQQQQLGLNNEPWIELACLALGKNFKEEIPALAQKLGLHYSVFRKAFKQQFGLAPGDYRLHCRLSLAQQLLEEGLAIGEVAEQLEYPDIYSFSAQFKKKMGVSPRQWTNIRMNK